MPLSNFAVGKKERAYALSDNYTGGIPNNPTNVLCRASKEGLFFTFEVTDNDLATYGKNYNDPLWKGDVVEIFLTLGSRNRYLEIEVNPDNAQYAAVITNESGEGDFQIEFINSPPLESTVSKSESGWTANIFMPFDKLKELNWEPKHSFINLYRQDYRPDGELKLYALSPTMCGSFHKVKSFIPFQCEEIVL